MPFYPIFVIPQKRESRVSCENRNPVNWYSSLLAQDDIWTPAFAGVTAFLTFYEIIKFYLIKTAMTDIMGSKNQRGKNETCAYLSLLYFPYDRGVLLHLALYGGDEIIFGPDSGNKIRQDH